MFESNEYRKDKSEPITIKPVNVYSRKPMLGFFRIVDYFHILIAIFCPIDDVLLYEFVILLT